MAREIPKSVYTVGTDTLRAELAFVHDGLNGTYNPDDPEDSPLLHLTVEQSEKRGEDMVWSIVDCYCTDISATDEPKDIMSALGAIWGMYEKTLKKGDKKDIERLGAGIRCLSARSLILGAGCVSHMDG